MHNDAGDLSSVLKSDLDASGWDGSVEPYPGITPLQYAKMSLFNSIVKKFHNDKTDEIRDKLALDLFLNVNESCREFVFDVANQTTSEAIAFGEAKDFLYRFFYRNDSDGDQLLTLRKISEGFGVGNGANIGAESTSFYSKVANGMMSATSEDLHDLYVQATSFDPIWKRTEITRQQKYGHNVVKNSRLSFVPKSAKISRTICTEPVLNMLFQKGIASLLERELRISLGIDLSTQPDKNRELCRIGSETGKYGTIDLRSASDSMSLTLVHEFFPPAVTRWLMRTRCASASLPGGRLVDLHMVSSMGNAFTFPLQTLFFSALVYGAYRVHGIPMDYPKGVRLGNFAVFGDDIIVDRRVYNTVVRLLSLSGFTVNVDKSFNTGLFRESCGHDYYCGYNVRGVYIQKLRNVCDCYSAINRLNRWSARHGVFLPNTVQYLSHGRRFLPVPYDEDDACGIKVPSSMLREKVVSKFTGGLRYQFSLQLPITVQLPDSDSVEEMTRNRLKRHFPKWSYNHDGLLLAMLHGSIRRGSLGIRAVANPKTVIRTRYSSRWDYITSARGESRDYGEKWKFFTWFNLNCN